MKWLLSSQKFKAIARSRMRVTARSSEGAGRCEESREAGRRSNPPQGDTSAPFCRRAQFSGPVPMDLKIGDVILIAGRNPAIEQVQKKAGYGDSSKWTHVLGCLGGYRCIEACIPRSRLVDLKKEYLDKGYEVKVLRRKGEHNHHRFKVALWWATMNNLPYDTLQFFWFPLSLWCTKICIGLHRLFSSDKRLICSELIVQGFYKEGDYLFGKPAELVLPADFDNMELFD